MCACVYTHGERVCQMEILKIKNATEIINSEDGCNSLLVIGEEKIGELIGRSLEPIQAWNAKRMGKYRNKHGRHMGKDERFLNVCNWSSGRKG